MKFTNHTTDTVAELLLHLAKNESFASIGKLQGWNKSEVKQLFEELANGLKEAAKKEPVVSRAHLSNQDLGHKTSTVISQLSPQEEAILFKSFKIS